MYIHVYIYMYLYVFVALLSLMGQMPLIRGLGSGPWSSAYRFSTGEPCAPSTMPAPWLVQVPGQPCQA